MINHTNDPGSFGDTYTMSAEEKSATKVFLIDDEPLILELYEVFLATAGFDNVYAFSDSVEAIETLRFLTPSIILTDIHMPEVSGNFLIKLIRTYEHLRTVPVVAITSDKAEESQKITMRKGADLVMHKPVNSATLAKCVTQVMASTNKLKIQLSEADQREQKLNEQKKAAMMSLESDLRNMMR